MSARSRMAWFSRSSAKNSDRAHGWRRSWPLSMPATEANGLMAALYISLVYLYGRMFSTISIRIRRWVIRRLRLTPECIPASQTDIRKPMADSRNADDPRRDACVRPVRQTFRDERSDALDSVLTSVQQRIETVLDGDERRRIGNAFENGGVIVALGAKQDDGVGGRMPVGEGRRRRRSAAADDRRGRRVAAPRRSWPHRRPRT